MSFSYANPTSGPSAGGIEWFDFGNLTLNDGDTVTGVTGTLMTEPSLPSMSVCPLSPAQAGSLPLYRYPPSLPPTLE